MLDPLRPEILFSWPKGNSFSWSVFNVYYPIIPSSEAVTLSSSKKWAEIWEWVEPIFTLNISWTNNPIVIHYKGLLSDLGTQSHSRKQPLRKINRWNSSGISYQKAKNTSALLFPETTVLSLFLLLTRLLLISILISICYLLIVKNGFSSMCVRLAHYISFNLHLHTDHWYWDIFNVSISHLSALFWEGFI